MFSLTSRQARLLDFIAGELARSGVGPSVEEMRRALGLATKSSVLGTLARLEERGRIRRLPGRARAIEVIRHPAAARPAPVSRAPDGAPLFWVPA